MQLAAKCRAKEDTCAVAVAGPTARNASVRRTVIVCTPRPLRSGVLAVAARRVTWRSCLRSGLVAAAALGSFLSVVWGACKFPSALSTLAAGHRAGGVQPVNSTLSQHSGERASAANIFGANPA